MNWNKTRERWAAWKALQQQRKANGEAYTERYELGYKVFNRQGQHYQNYATSHAAEQAVQSLNAADGSIGDWNREALSRMSANPNTRANSSRT